jgi:iron complex outermembrane receptor protein
MSRTTALRPVFQFVLLLTATPAMARAQQRDTTILPALTIQATRGERAWLDVPFAVTRLDERSLFGRAGFGLQDALAQVPGVIAQSRYGGSDVRLVIRGFGARGAGDRSNAGTSRGVRLLLDVVPETEPDGRTAFDNVDLAAIAGIEVIRSNASALWGNAAGGVVSLSTIDPDHPRLSSAEIQLGSFGLRRAIVRGGGALGSGAIAASLVNTEFDGYRAHSGASRWTGSLSLVTNVGSRSRLGLYAVATDNLFRIPGPLTRAAADTTPATANATYASRDERRHNRLGRLAVTLAHDLGGGASLSGMVFAAPKYLQRSERGTFRDFTRYHIGGNVVGRLEHHLGGGSRGRLTAGVDEAYQDGAILFYSLAPGGIRGDTLRDNKREGANNVGLFVQEELDLSSRLMLAVGARYDVIAYYYDSFIDPGIDARKAFRRVTPKVGATWRLTPSQSVYASVGGGVEAPAGNETDPASTFGQDTITAINPLLNPIRSTTLEIGMKHLSVLESGVLRSVMYDLAVYTTGVTDDIVPYRGGRFYFTAGKTRRSGVELGLRLETRAGLQLQSALTWSRNRYVTYLVDSVHYGVPGAFVDYSGNKAVGVPDFIYDVGVSYARPSGAPVALRLAFQGMSRFFADDANAVSVPGYGVVNATVGLDRPLEIGRSIGVRGFVTVNNLLDRKYIGSAFLNPDIVGGVPVAFEPGLPRNVVVSFSIGRR